MLSRDSIVGKSEVLKPADMYEEYGFLNIETGKYYLVNKGGSIIYDQVDGKRSIGELIQYFVTNFNVEPEICESDVLRFLEDMKSKGIVIVKE